MGCARTLYDLRFKPDRFNCFIAPAIAIELVHSGDDIKRVLADIGTWLSKESKQQTPAEFLLDGLRKDRLFIIPTYWTLLMVFSVLLYRHHFPQARWMGLAAAICVSAAAAWDYIGNNRNVFWLSFREGRDDSIPHRIDRTADWFACGFAGLQYG